ncbi:MAG: 2-oxoglutarate dehydrogenase complex dihydrolipoyllysine-residue succinyltransferase [Desulfuromonadia bacterium]
MDIVIPDIGESVREALVASWKVASGDRVVKDQPICELETDKITVELTAEADGVLTIDVPAGSTVPVGRVIGRITPDTVSQKSPSPPLSPHAPGLPFPPSSPSARTRAREKGVSLAGRQGSGPRGIITPDDVERFAADATPPAPGSSPPPPTQAVVTEAGHEIPAVRGDASPPSTPPPREGERVIPLSPIRRRIAERLQEARRTSVMLTTFNEIDMTSLLAMRKRLNEQRGEGIPKLGIVSFFARATALALPRFPLLNARMEKDSIVMNDHIHLGVAVGTDRGLLVPVIRNLEKRSLVDIEKELFRLTEAIRQGTILLSELEGGTFSLTNGGVYGSLMSTPVLNPPQSGILGIHAIKERPAVVDGKILPRPMMYVALTYDHRIVDGKDAVQFLRRIVELVEKPEELAEG